MTFKVGVILDPHVQTSKLSEICKRTVNRNINTNPNPTSRYVTLTLFKNVGHGTPGYEKVRVIGATTIGTKGDWSPNF